jgi:lipoprotein-anchoring transpeptidase ErfK/SrfK
MIVLGRRAFMIGAAACASDCLTNCASTSMWSRGPDPVYRRKVVEYSTQEKPGTIVVDPAQHYLYFVRSGGDAMRYGVGVGGEGYGWSGKATVHDKREWPDWYPTEQYLEQHPQVRPALRELQSGSGVAGGPENPLGARAMYLWQGNKDTLYRIHGTNEPWTIGKNVSAGCIRLVNEDVIDLYNRTPIGTKVVVLPLSVG